MPRSRILGVPPPGKAPKTVFTSPGETLGQLPGGTPEDPPGLAQGLSRASPGARGYLSRSAAFVRAAWAAASRATGTRNGEQDT